MQWEVKGVAEGLVAIMDASSMSMHATETQWYIAFCYGICGQYSNTKDILPQSYIQKGVLLKPKNPPSSGIVQRSITLLL